MEQFIVNTGRSKDDIHTDYNAYCALKKRIDNPDSLHDIDYNKDEVEIAFELAKRCVDGIIMGDQVHQHSDIDPQELSDFIDNMLPDQFAQIMEFMQSIPELYYSFKYTCPTCQETVLVELKSVSDFFQ